MTYIQKIAEEIRKQVGSQRLPSTETEELFEIYALLALTRGLATTRRDVHDAWVVWMLWRGEEHHSMVPYENLSTDVQADDEPFAEAIRHVAGLLTSAGGETDRRRQREGDT